MTRYALAVLLGAMCALSPARAGEGVPAGCPIENGGFEEWAELDAGTAKREDVRNLDLFPERSGPTGWVPVRELAAGQARTATVGRDDQVRHGGAHSVRVENRDMRDISYVLYSTERFSGKADDAGAIRPNRRYLLGWWVKGEGVEPSGTGPILMMYVSSEKEGKPVRTDSHEPTDALPKGTFDWQRRQHLFITGPNAKWAAFTFQLRWTTGTVWYDDVELLDVGPVVPVETY